MGRGHADGSPILNPASFLMLMPAPVSARCGPSRRIGLLVFRMLVIAFGTLEAVFGADLRWGLKYFRTL